MNKELLREALEFIETGRDLAASEAASYHESMRGYKPQQHKAHDDGVLAFDALLIKVRAAIDAPEPYDQQALELCDACGWKALIPDDCCLNCTRPHPEQGPFGWHSAKYDEFMLHQLKTDHGRLGTHTSKSGGFDLPLYTKPQPVADLQIRLDLMTAERDKLHRENGDMRQSLHFFKPVAELTDAEIKAIVEKCANDQWPDVGYVGWSVVDTEFYACLVKAVLAAQEAKR